MASFDGGELFQNGWRFGDDKCSFSPKKGKAGPFLSARQCASKATGFIKGRRHAQADVQPDSAGRDTFPGRCLDRLSRPAPMRSCNGRLSMIRPVETQPTVVYSHIG
jgi:hypothetical protein